MKKDDTFSLWSEVRKAGEATSFGISAGLSIGEHAWLEQGSESGDADASACKAEELSTRQDEFKFSIEVHTSDPYHLVR